MRRNLKSIILTGCLMTISLPNSFAQSYTWVSSTEGDTWKQAKVKLQSSAGQTQSL